MKASIGMAMMLVLASALPGAWAGVDPAPAQPGTPRESATIYDPDPGHLWNRLFAGFYRQNIAYLSYTSTGIKFGGYWIREASWVGPDVVDPPLGYHPRFLLENEPFAACNALLDEFLNMNGAALIHDPLKRAVLQRDLWAVFDILARAGQTPTGEFSMGAFVMGENPRIPVELEQHRIILERKLAQAIRSLALSPAEIERLPDTYDAAIKSGAFSDVLETNRYNFLPHGIFATNSGWQEILPGPIHAKGPPILDHTLIGGGRSVFRSFIKLPAGSRTSAIPASRVENVVSTPPKDREPFPMGTQFLLLREMICLDEDGQMVPTHMVESVQFRITYRTEREHRLFCEAELSRTLLFEGRQGGLRPVAGGELRIEAYNGLGHLSVDGKGNGPPQLSFPKNCASCHAPNTMLSHVAAFTPPARSVSIEPIARWKKENGKLDLLLLLSTVAGGK